MQTAKLFMNGGSQAVRLPKDCRFEGDEVVVKRVGHGVYLFPDEKAWEDFTQRPSAEDGFGDAIFEARQAAVQTRRESL